MCFLCLFVADSSEDQLHRELNISWPATAHEWIADADVWCDGDRQEACSATSCRIHRSSHVSGKSRQQWIRKIRMIEDVEDLRSQLNPKLLIDLSVFEDREVDVVITRSTQRVSTKRAEVPRPGNTRSRATVA